MFEFRNVSFSYEDPDEQETEYDKRSKKIKIDETLIPKKVFAVEELNFTIEDGEFVSVIGRNGSGKSTCAKLMNGLLLPESGTCIRCTGIQPDHTVHMAEPGQLALGVVPRVQLQRVNRLIQRRFAQGIRYHFLVADGFHRLRVARNAAFQQ